MNLFNSLILQTQNILQGPSAISREYDPDRSWKTLPENQLVLLRDSSIELGADGSDSVSFSLLTSDESLIHEDGTRLLGNDLPDIDRNTHFGKIILLKVKSLSEDEDRVYTQIKDIDYLKYKMYLDGYMSRISNELCREHVRISKKAHRKGISLEQVGNAIITRYKSHPLVEKVQVWFITGSIPYPDFKKLTDLAQKNRKIISAMNHILDDLNFDCNTCSLKPVCDEVEGLREYHKRTAGMN